MMLAAKRFQYDTKPKGSGQARTDRHKAHQPPGRCRAVPVLSESQQIHKFSTAHMITRMQAKQDASDQQDELWSITMEKQQVEEQLAQEQHAHHASKLALFKTQKELDQVKIESHDKDNEIRDLKKHLAAMKEERDRALAENAGLHSALQTTHSTMSQQSSTISIMQRQLDTHVSAISRLHSELDGHSSTTQHPATQLQQQAFQDSHSPAGMSSTWDGYLPGATTVSSLRHSLATTVLRAPSYPPALDAPMQPAASLTTTTDTIDGTDIQATPSDTDPPQVDVLGSLKATASSMVGKGKEGIMKGWSKAVSFGADGIGHSLSAMSVRRASCSSSDSNVEMSRWGSFNLSMSAASSRWASTNSTNDISSTISSTISSSST